MIFDSDKVVRAGREIRFLISGSPIFAPLVPKLSIMGSNALLVQSTGKIRCNEAVV